MYIQNQQLGSFYTVYDFEKAGTTPADVARQLEAKFGYDFIRDLSTTELYAEGVKNKIITPPMIWTFVPWQHYIRGYKYIPGEGLVLTNEIEPNWKEFEEDIYYEIGYRPGAPGGIFPWLEDLYIDNIVRAFEDELLQAKYAKGSALSFEEAVYIQNNPIIIDKFLSENPNYAAPNIIRDTFRSQIVPKLKILIQQSGVDLKAEAAAAQAQAQAQAETEATALRELEKTQTTAVRNFPWFEADMFVNATAQQKADAYRRYKAIGKTDAEIRQAAEYFFGQQKDEDWILLQQMANDIEINAALQQTTTQPAGNAGAIALAALAAALLLGA